MSQQDSNRPVFAQNSDLISEPELGLRWKKSLRTLQRMRDANVGPPWLSIGRSVFYRVGDILEFEKNSRHGEGT